MDPDLSLLFYKYLCDVIGSKEVVTRRRQIFTAYDKSQYGVQMFPISSGSKAEGLDLPGSDFDLMFVMTRFRVYESEETFKRSVKNVSFLMETDNTKIGFTKLKCLFTHRTPPIIKEWCDLNGYCFSKHFREIPHMDRIARQVITGHSHGPCFTVGDDSSGIDFAVAFRCQKWITIANPWIRRTQFSWASQDTIKKIINFGILFVPIGSKNHRTTDREWRISFSFAEKLLIWSFNHVQLLCYALLKIILKEIIKETHPDILCSYFLKTIMFWLCEETEKSQWKMDNILVCYKNCLKRLIYCVRTKTCSHYFIPDNNLFENRFDNENHASIMSTLGQLLDGGLPALLRSKTLQPFRALLAPLVSSEIVTVSYLSCLHYTTWMRLPYDLTNCVSCLNGSKTNQFLIYNLSIASQAMSHIISKKNGKDRKDTRHSYKQYNTCLSHLLIGLNHDALSGWLLLASFFYVNRQYHKCSFILDYCWSKDVSENFPVRPDADKTIEHRFNHIMKTHKLSVINGMKFFTTEHVRKPPCSDIIPWEFDLLIYRNPIDLLYANFDQPIQVEIFTFILTFLCAVRLEYNQHSVEEIDNAIAKDITKCIDSLLL